MPELERGAGQGHQPQGGQEQDASSIQSQTADARVKVLLRRRNQKRRAEAAGGGAGLGAAAEGGHAGLDPAMRSKAEASLGADLGGVRVHQGPAAAQANAELGSRAFAHGQDIVLGSGVENSANPIVAHEVAHTVQQRGAAPGVAPKLEREGASSLHERDADQAAARMLAGRPATIRAVGAERVQCFEGGEHWELGEGGAAQAGFGREITVGKVHAPAGAFTALMGDFYGDGPGAWDRLKADCESNPDRVNRYIAVLSRERSNRAAGRPTENVGEILVAGQNADFLTKYASVNFAHFSEKTDQSAQDFHSTAIQHPEYAHEIAHYSRIFGGNISQWLLQHMSAVGQAFRLGMSRGAVDEAVAMDASASHYLTDAFSSGHMRTPRHQIMDVYTKYFETTKGRVRTRFRAQIDQVVDDHIPNQVDVAREIAGDTVGGAVSTATSYLSHKLGGSGGSLTTVSLIDVKRELKTFLYSKSDPVADQLESAVTSRYSDMVATQLHDHDNDQGLVVKNEIGEWKAYGDDHLKESPMSAKYAEKAVAASLTHIRQVYDAGNREAGGAAGKHRIPHLPLRNVLKYVPLPVADNVKTKLGANKPQDDWSPPPKDPLRQEAISHFVERGAGTVNNILAQKAEISHVIAQAVQKKLASLGAAGDWLASKSGPLSEWILGKIPTAGAGFETTLREALTYLLS